MRIMITGASGLLGSNVALEAAPKHQVFGVVNATPMAADAFTVLTADLLDETALANLFEHTQPDWVIHCAALANLESCEKNPELARRINTEVPALLAKIVDRGGARLLHVSTDAVFDGAKGSYREEDQPNPLSVYARTKLDGERAVAEANPDAIIARVNLFGFSPTGKRSLAEFFLNNLLAGKPMKGFTDVFFCPMLVNDIAHIFFKMLSKQLSGIYHVFSADYLSKYGFGVQLAHKFGLDAALISPSEVATGGLTAARSPNLTMNTYKLSTALGADLPKISPMLAHFYTLYQQNYPQRLQAMVLSDQ